ncbi:MAG: hypothetical protein NVSMB51_17400 [Solirubrobacteraceae bacterium]
MGSLGAIAALVRRLPLANRVEQEAAGLLALAGRFVDLGEAILALGERLDARAETILALGERIDAQGAQIVGLGERVDARAEAILALGVQLDDRGTAILALGERLLETGQAMLPEARLVHQRAGELSDHAADLVAVLPMLEQAVHLATPLEGAVDRLGRIVDRLPGDSRRKRAAGS